MRISFVCVWFLFYSSVFAELDTEWWKHTIIYELIPYSFKDSDDDGIGDFKGITSKLDHFVDLGIETIHLTPNFETTSRDMGYDITDFYKVEPRLGTMADFDELIREMNKRNMKLILDLVINHSSHKHEWFQKSIDRIDPYTDFYVWKNSKVVKFVNGTEEQIPPNKWVSLFSGEEGSGWTWNEKRNQFYFHQFLVEQPDFDLRNENLKKELKKMIEFWLDRGVAGFRLDATPFYFEDKDFRDDDPYRQYNQPEIYEFIHELRIDLDKYNQKQGGFERIFIAEAHVEDEEVLRYYGTKDYPVTHFPYAFIFEHMYEPSSLRMLKLYLDQWMEHVPKGEISAWMTQDHDGPRVGSRLGPEYSDIFTMLSMMMPGTVGVYYGQEIAMIDGFIYENQIKDYSGRGTRDPNRLTMQWDDTINAGFSVSTTPYLPANSDYFERNVENQKSQTISHYNLFKDLSNLRKTDTFRYGKYQSYAFSSNFRYGKYRSYAFSSDVFVVKRFYQGDVLAIAVNFLESSSTLNLTKILQNPSSEVITVAASVNSGYSNGLTVEKEFYEEFYMRPLSSVVLQTTEPKTDDKSNS